MASVPEKPARPIPGSYLALTIKLRKREMTLETFNKAIAENKRGYAWLVQDIIGLLPYANERVAIAKAALAATPKRATQEIERDLAGYQADLARRKAKTSNYDTNLSAAAYSKLCAQAPKIDRITTICIPALEEELARAS
jgi:hypothetical protein